MKNHELNIGRRVDGSAFRLPLDAAVQTFALIARKGAGKSYAAGKLVEEFYDHDIQCIILDSVGNWYGLRIAADGKGIGLDMPVLGGLRGDIPLDASAGALIADVAVDSGRSLIIDVSQFSKADRQRFATAFGQQLWKRKKAQASPTPIHLFIEESQLIVPQKLAPDQGMMYGVYEEIIRLGRNYGVGVTMITQRPQSVNKEVLNMTECLFVLQVNGSQERQSLKDWIVSQGMDKSLTDELPGLPIGTAFIWSPQWLRVLEKIEIGKKRTYDSTATPRPGQVGARAEIKPLDMDDLKSKMAATIEHAKANDPREMKKRIQELEEQLAAREPVIDQDAIDAAVQTERESHRAFLDHIRQLVDQAMVMVHLEKASQASRFDALLVSESCPDDIEPAKPVAPPAAVGFNGELTSGERALLETAARRHPMRLTISQLGTLAGYTPSTVRTYLPRLKAGGYIEQRGRELELTRSGLRIVGGSGAAPKSIGEVQQMWLSRLPAGEAKILQALIARKGGFESIEQLSSATQLTPSSLRTYIPSLRRNGLMERGELRATNEIFGK